MSKRCDVLDFPHNGIGDVVMGAWLVASARAAGKTLLINPRYKTDVAHLLGVRREELTHEPAHSTTDTPGHGLRYEYETQGQSGKRRFDIWAETHGLHGLDPVRPEYVESDADAAWAETEWNAIDPLGRKPRVMIFPETAWSIRAWPLCNYVDLAGSLIRRGCCVAGFGTNENSIRAVPGKVYWGQELARVAAMAARADLVIANDSGPAHLCAALGTRAIAVMGPTAGRVVFGHEPNVRVVSNEHMKCTGCHFDAQKGYRKACDAGGCQSLLRLPWEPVLEAALHELGTTEGRDESAGRGGREASVPLTVEGRGSGAA